MFQVPSYATKELSKRTWFDFVKLFSQGNGWDFCWCMHFHRPQGLPKSEHSKSRKERGKRNRREKSGLVESGCAHGILVYADGKPIGWCQYGSQEELPRVDGSRNYRAAAPDDGTKRLWRITCFVVDKKYRGRGAASAALQAALEAIKTKGGGVVEAYPLMPWEEVCRSRIRRCGYAPSFGNSSTHGTLSMFEKQGFRTVGPFGNGNVLMRRTV